MATRKNGTAIIGMLAMLTGLVGTGGFVVVALHHIIVGVPFNLYLMATAGCIGIILIGSFLMEIGGVQATTKRRGKK